MNSNQKDPQMKPKIQAHFSTMPSIFYGGVDPRVQYKTEDVIPKEIQPQQPIIEKKTPPVAPAQVTQPAVTKKSPPLFWIILGIIVFLVAVLGISWYYLNQAGFFNRSPESPIPEETTNKPPEQIPTQTTTTTPPPIITTTTEEIEEPGSLQEPPLEFPAINSIDSSDLDEDNLTDAEEEVFSTDSGIWDSDQDGYYDGQEVANLYNPNGFAPVRIIDSGLVREYVNPNWQYRMYYPVVWQIDEVDSVGNQVLLSGVSGDFIEIRAVTKQQAQTFANWFAQKAEGEVFLDLVRKQNRFNFEFYSRNDSLVTYFERGDVVFVFIYHPATQGPVNYRHIMEMVAQSFRFGPTENQIPEQQQIVPNPEEDFGTETNAPSVSQNEKDLIENV